MIETREILDELAKKNWRGISTPDMVCELQFIQENVADYPDDPDHLYFLRRYIANITKELQRRQIMPVMNNVSGNKQVVEAIKDKVGANGLVDIISRNTDVFVDKRTWQFRCPFGEDQHPSGVIYKDELRWWCFRCNRGGD